MGVRRPGWWCYPERCSNGHEWGPGRIIVSWVMCDCGPAQAARTPGAPAGHMAVFCNAVPGCRSVWYRPRCERGLAVPIATPTGAVLHQEPIGAPYPLPPRAIGEHDRNGMRAAIIARAEPEAGRLTRLHKYCRAFVWG